MSVVASFGAPLVSVVRSRIDQDRRKPKWDSEVRLLRGRLVLVRTGKHIHLAGGRPWYGRRPASSGFAMTDRTYFGLKFPDFLNRILWGASALLFVLMAVAAFAHSNGAWPLCVAGVACMVFANLDRISTISASTSGINIALGRAEVSVAQMTRLIRMSATLQLAIVQRTGRWDGFNAEEKEAFLNESISLLREAGIGDGEIRDLRFRAWDRFELYDHVIGILGGGQIPQPHDDAIQKEWEGLRQLEHLPTAMAMRDFLQKYGVLTDDREEMIKDYEFYETNRTYRRPSHHDRVRTMMLQGIRITKPNDS
jgi:hypothetical protein